MPELKQASNVSQNTLLQMLLPAERERRPDLLEFGGRGMLIPWQAAI